MVLERHVELPGGSEIVVIPRVEWAELLDPRPIPLVFHLLDIKARRAWKFVSSSFKAFPAHSRAWASASGRCGEGSRHYRP